MTTSAALTELYVHECGTPGSPAIVFLHADGASGGMWDQHMGRFAGYHCLAPDLPGHGRSSHLPWSSLEDTTQQVVGLIEGRIPARRAHVVGLSLGGVVAHTLLAQRPELLDRVVIDGCGLVDVLPARGVGLWKLGFALVSPFIHRGPVIGLFARMVGVAPSGREQFAADLRAVSPAASRRALPRATTSASLGRSSALGVRPCWWRGNESSGPPRLECGACRPDARCGSQVRPWMRSCLVGRGPRAAWADGAGLDQRAGVARGVGARDHRVALRAGAAPVGGPLATTLTGQARDRPQHGERQVRHRPSAAALTSCVGSGAVRCHRA
jgi:pimeloyl-ACP methyl ester carboxylesterase